MGLRSGIRDPGSGKTYRYSGSRIRRPKGTGFRIRNTGFWASRIRVGNHESESWIWILLSLSKNSKKTLIFTILWLLYDFLALSNYVNVTLKSNKQKTETNIFCCRHHENHWQKQQSGSISQRFGSADPDPHPHPDPYWYQNFMDPQHCLPKCHGFTTLLARQSGENSGHTYCDFKKFQIFYISCKLYTGFLKMKWNSNGIDCFYKKYKLAVDYFLAES